METLISVAIPVYKPELRFLRETLASVLNSGVDPGLLELTVVNDDSRADGVEEVVREYGDLIGYHQNPVSLGIANNWNRCIELANCKWIHILHQDDLVLPGYYQELLRVDRNPDVKAFVSRYFVINENGNITGISQLEQDFAGTFESAAEKIITTNTVQCPSIAVKKEVYSAIGGFNPSLSYALDWEMWFRVSRSCSIWYVPTPLVCFRMHSSSETPRVKESGESAMDMIRGTAIVASYAPDFARKASEYSARHMISTAIEFLMHRRWKAGAYQLRVASRCLPRVLGWSEYWRCWLWVTRIVLRNAMRTVGSK